MSNVSDEIEVPECDKEIFAKGKGVCVVVGDYRLPSPAVQVEAWVRAIAERAKARVDWHYSGGRASVLHLGDAESRQRVLSAIHELRKPFEDGGGSILSIDGPALFRGGRDNVPEGAMAVIEDAPGERQFIVDPSARGAAGTRGEWRRGGDERGVTMDYTKLFTEEMQRVAKMARDKALDDAAALHESISPACDHEREHGAPGAGAMGAVIEYRDRIRALKGGR